MVNAFICPGQGSQKVGMGKDLFDTFESAKIRFNEADQLLGKCLSKIIFEGPSEELTATQNTQPALFTIECIIIDILRDKGILPKLCLGHSLGEYSALYAAGFFSFSNGLALVSKRGALMARAGELAPGAMAAVIGLSKDAIKEVLSTIKGTIVTANEKSPEQTVISGEIEAVNTAESALKKAGAKRVIKLPVSGAFHSPLMEPVAQQFSQFIGSIQFTTPQCPIISNVTAQEETDPETVRSLCIKQLTSPVRWVDSISYTQNKSISRYIETGPGNVLTGLLRKCNDDLNVVPCGTVDNVYSLES